jgi:hypothetical protein
MNWSRILNQAREDAGSWIGEALKHRREHPGVYALAHAYAATHYRLDAKAARAAGRRLAARWLDLRALFHRRRREHFERRAKATAEANQCAAMMAAKADRA